MTEKWSSHEHIARLKNSALECIKYHKQEFRDLIFKTIHENKEYGCILCRDQYSNYTLSDYCEGSYCSIMLHNCIDTIRIGTFHTHYKFKIFKVGYPSSTDVLADIDDQFNLIGFFTLGFPWISAYTINKDSIVYTVLSREFYELTKDPYKKLTSEDWIKYDSMKKAVRDFYSELVIILFRYRLPRR